MGVDHPRTARFFLAINWPRYKTRRYRARSFSVCLRVAADRHESRLERNRLGKKLVSESASIVHVERCSSIRATRPFSPFDPRPRSVHRFHESKPLRVFTIIAARVSSSGAPCSRQPLSFYPPRHRRRPLLPVSTDERSLTTTRSRSIRFHSVYPRCLDRSSTGVGCLNTL